MTKSPYETIPLGKLKPSLVTTLSGTALDWATAVYGQGVKPEHIRITKERLYRWYDNEDGSVDTTSYVTGPELLYTRLWEASGAFIRLYNISLLAPDKDRAQWRAEVTPYSRTTPVYCADEPLTAVCRCVVAFHRGNMVDIPMGLLK